MVEQKQGGGVSADADRATAAEPVVSALRDGIPDVGDKTALSYWFPKLVDAGLPVPETRFCVMPQAAREAVFALLWGENADQSPVEPFLAELRGQAERIGAPIFLRTDHTSGKHQWSEACFVRDLDNLGAHVCQIAEYSEIAGGLFGLPWQVWVVREMLPTLPVATCPAYSDMPVCKEFRFFVDGGSIDCFHPYWPRDALEQGGANLNDKEFAALCEPTDLPMLRDIAARAGEAVGGRWSVDMLWTARGWFVTDMAEAEKSYHWEGCPAKAIEAGTDETRSGSARQGESAARKGLPEGGPHG